MQNRELYLNPADAARQLGVSTKALRIYETRGLLTPTRTAAGWRTYGPDAMARAGQIIALRALGMGLDQIGCVLAGDALALERALTAQRNVLEGQIGMLGESLVTIREMRASIRTGDAPSAADLPDLQHQ